MGRFNDRKGNRGGFGGNRGDRFSGNRGDRFSGNRGGGFGGFQNKEMHKAICADCGKECEVPFKPTEGRPVYCRDCYRNHKTF